jgi:hypothetical protein
MLLHNTRSPALVRGGRHWMQENTILHSLILNALLNPLRPNSTLRFSRPFESMMLNFPLCKSLDLLVISIDSTLLASNDTAQVEIEYAT